jgi:hypothetical protein
MKLPVPTENEHRAFCTPGCFESFYRNRCRVCECDLRKTGKPGDAGRLYCRPPAKCRQEAARWPEKYGDGSQVVISTTELRNADSTGVRFGIAGYPPTASHCPRAWWWGDAGIGDLSLYDGDGLTLARLVLEGDGHYHLRAPVTWPRQAWPDLDEEARRRAEIFALMAMIDPKFTARIKREDEAPHLMGAPLNRAPAADAVALGADRRRR